MDGLKDHKCKKIALRKCPRPVPYVTKKHCVQETVSAFKDNHLKMHISKSTELQVPIWTLGMRKAFLIHVGSALEAIKRKGHLRPNVEQRGRIKQAKAQLAELNDSPNGESGTYKKSTKKSNVTTAEASPTDPALQAELVSEISKIPMNITFC
jgi:hypothetical protein